MAQERKECSLNLVLVSHEVFVCIVMIQIPKQIHNFLFKFFQVTSRNWKHFQTFIPYAQSTAKQNGRRVEDTHATKGNLWRVVLVSHCVNARYRNIQGMA